MLAQGTVVAARHSIAHCTLSAAFSLCCACYAESACVTHNLYQHKLRLQTWEQAQSKPTARHRREAGGERALPPDACLPLIHAWLAFLWPHLLQSFIELAAAPGPAIAKGNPAVLTELLEEENVTSSSSSSSDSNSSSSSGSKATGSTTVEGKVAPNSPHFTGLVFKLQANMDPKHRDKVAFVRVGECLQPTTICTQAPSGSFTALPSRSCRRTGQPARLVLAPICLVSQADGVIESLSIGKT